MESETNYKKVKNDNDKYEDFFSIKGRPKTQTLALNLQANSVYDKSCMIGEEAASDFKFGPLSVKNTQYSEKQHAVSPFRRPTRK